VRKAVCRQFGSLDQLMVEEGDDLEPRPRYLVVDVKAAGVNFVDSLVVQGRHQLKPDLPLTPGGEIAGVVSALGAEVTGFELGDAVFGMCLAGGFASQAAIHMRATRPVPPTLTFRQAASFVHSYGTALFALTRSTRLGVGEWVVVLGAGGGVGLAAVDVAVHLGARVIAAASSEEKRSLARRQGAMAAIDYGTGDLKARVRELTGGGAQVVVDPVGGSPAEAALRSLAPGGRYLAVGFASGTIPRLPLNHVLLGNRSVLGVEWGSWAQTHPRENDSLLDELVAAAANGRLHPVEPIAYPLDQAAAALTDLEERRVTGKVVLVP
jgi:NADPH2:quinone reductase